MWEYLNQPNIGELLAEDTGLAHQSPNASAVVAFVEMASAEPYADKLSVVTSVGLVRLTSQRRFEDHMTAGVISVSASADGKIFLSYEPPFARRSSESGGLSPEEALVHLAATVERLLADHGAPSPEEESTDSQRQSPRFKVGDLVRVVANRRNTSLHEGRIRSSVWHHKHCCWTYYLEVNRKNVSKRYVAEDFEPC